MTLLTRAIAIGIVTTLAWMAGAPLWSAFLIVWAVIFLGNRK